MIARLLIYLVHIWTFLQHKAECRSKGVRTGSASRTLGDVALGPGNNLPRARTCYILHEPPLIFFFVDNCLHSCREERCSITEIIYAATEKDKN